MNRRSIGFWLGLVAVVLVVGFLSGGRQRSGPPLHPDSTDPTGTRALLILLDEQGATIADGLPDDTAGTALLLADQLDDTSRADLDRWVDAGGTLVVTDPSSVYSPPDAIFDSGDVLTAGVCTLPDLAGLQLEAGSFLRYPHAGSPVDGATADEYCFGDGAHSHLHVRRQGAGQVVAVGGGLIFTNQNLDEADNAVVAARLLLDGSGDDRVAVMFDPILAPGSRGLGDLIPSGAKWAAAQLLVAFALYVLWRLPRFGRPVPESQPVELPASLLVRATGELHRRAGGHQRASANLRADLDRRLRRQLRISPELPAPELVGSIAASGPVDAGTVGRALTGPTAVDGDGLAALLVDIDAVNRAVLTTDDGPHPADDDQTIGDHL